MLKRVIVSVAVVVVTLGLAVGLNQSPQRHRAKLKEVIGERSPIAGALGVGSIAAFVSTYHSLGVASYTTVGDQMRSIGAMGMIVVLQ